MKKNYAVWKVIAETAKHRNEVDGLGNKFTSSKTENFSLEICLDEILKKPGTTSNQESFWTVPTRSRKFWLN